MSDEAVTSISLTTNHLSAKHGPTNRDTKKQNLVTALKRLGLFWIRRLYIFNCKIVYKDVMSDTAAEAQNMYGCDKWL